MNSAERLKTLLAEEQHARAEAVLLKQQLAVAGISEMKEIAIRQQIVALDNRIAAGRQEISAFRLPDPVGSLRQRCVQWYWSAPAESSIFLLGSIWLALRYYSVARHHFAPYTGRQLHRRQWLLFLDAAAVPNAERACALSGFFAVWKGCANSAPPPSCSTPRFT
jgi:hypothetical protein